MYSRPVRVFRCFILLCCVILFPARDVHPQQIYVHSTAIAGQGWHAQYELHVDPDNSNNMMACGFKFEAKDDAWYGFVYSSSDRGKTWRLALEPRNSTFESEASCAYGTHGTAYYVTSASKVINGELHHELGTTRIYVSTDAGRMWALGATTGWADWSTSVVDTRPGPNQNRLYAFFNNPQTFYYSVGNKTSMEADAKLGNGTRVGLISFKAGDASVSGPFSSEAMAKEEFHGSYPSPAFVLNDGTLLALFSAKRRAAGSTREELVESVRTNSDRTSLDPPVKVISSLDNHDDISSISCGSYYLDPAATYDAVHNKVYFLYSAVRGDKCRLFLTNSTDEGRSWSKAQEIGISNTDGGDEEFADPAIAVNNEGVVALLWQKAFRSGCWMFVTSVDDGKSFSRAKPLGTCTASERKPSRLNTAYLWDSFFQADPKDSAATARIVVRNGRNKILGRNQDAIAVTDDGVFHPMWIDAANGSGELRTAAVFVTTVNKLIEKETRGLDDETTNVTLLYGGNQVYDPRTKTVTLDISVRNNSERELQAPLILAVPSIMDLGFADIQNASNGVSDAGAVWDISSAVSGGALAPGATTKPYSLKFRYFANPDTPRASDDILGVTLKVFAKTLSPQ